MTWPANLGDLTAADVMHRHLTTLPADTTVAELRAYFAASASRQLAVIADDGRYVGSVERSALPDTADATSPAAGHAVRYPTIGPRATGREARDQGLGEASRRVPVVDDAGALLGIVAINHGLDGFCGLDGA